jgi:hypothetical protein
MTDIRHIVFKFHIQTEYLYSYLLSEKVRISKNYIRTSVHHLRIRIQTDIFRTILHPYQQLEPANHNTSICNYARCTSSQSLRPVGPCHRGQWCSLLETSSSLIGFVISDNTRLLWLICILQLCSNLSHNIGKWASTSENTLELWKSMRRLRKDY